MAALDQVTTEEFIVAWCAVALAWEAWTCSDKVPKNTISEIIWGWAKHLFIVRFVVAFLFAHFFFQRDESAADGVGWRLLKSYPVLVTFMGLFAGYIAWQRAPKLANSKP